MSFQEILDYTILQVGSFHLKLYSIVLVVILCTLLRTILWVVHKIVYQTKMEQSQKYAIYRISKYVTLILGIAVGLDWLGINVTVLVAGSAALLVGIGLGLQDLFRDFISGIILLIDSTIKVGDIIEIDKLVAKVVEINMRTTTVITRGDKHLILPNSMLTTHQLHNWTHSEATARFYICVGVAYGSDVTLVMRLLCQAMEGHHKVLKQPMPFVRFDNFGESSLDFIGYFWADEVFRIEQIKSDIRVSIYKLLNDNDITIPFPQRTLHMSK